MEWRCQVNYWVDISLILSDPNISAKGQKQSIHTDTSLFIYILRWQNMETSLRRFVFIIRPHGSEREFGRNEYNK